MLLLDTSRASERGILLGVAKYSQLFGPWMLTSLPPLYRRSGIERYTSSAAKQEVDGIVVSLKYLSKGFRVGEVPTVGVDVREPMPDVPNVMGDSDVIAAMAVEHFLERGYRQFAYCGFESIRWAAERCVSFTRQLVDTGYMVHVYKGSRRRRTQEVSQIGKWLQRLPTPIALFCCNDERARQACNACQAGGLRVPEDVAILGVDNDELVCLSSYPPLSSIALDFVQAGFDAARVLHEMMARRKKSVVRDITIKATHILTRQSTDILAVDDPVVRQAVRFILANRRKPIQVPDVLQQVTVSRRSLYDRFEQVLGCSVYQFIKRVRIREIERLLLETDYSVAEIANLVGFSTPEHIASYFRSVRGINPLALRQKRHGR